MTKWSLAIHGGAGIISRDEENSTQYHLGLNAALKAGAKVLKNHGSAIDAVCAAVVCLEDNPLFNAGLGSVLTEQGEIELDAAIMDGLNQMAGAIAGVNKVKNPVLLARTVMEKSGRLFLIGEGAHEFAFKNGFEEMNPHYFITPKRLEQLEKWRARQLEKLNNSHKFGTVGAVALDMNGNLAAATSTGGMTGKIKGRIGDCPVIGAGTIAINGLAAVSCTGTGEYFIRESAGRQICDRIRWNKEDIFQAAQNTILSIGQLGGDGGLIAMDKNGNAAFALNDLGMYRGHISNQSQAQTAIFPEDGLKPLGKFGKTSDEMH